MMYPFMTLDDKTEIVHSDKQADGCVGVYIEKPDAKDGFHHATCYLPEYRWDDVYGFSTEEMKNYQEFIESTAHLILEFAKEGGVFAPKFYFVELKTLNRVMNATTSNGETDTAQWMTMGKTTL